MRITPQYVGERTNEINDALWSVVKWFFEQYNATHNDCLYVIDDDAKTVAATKYDKLPILFYYWDGSRNWKYPSLKAYGMAKDFKPHQGRITLTSIIGSGILHELEAADEGQLRIRNEQGYDRAAEEAPMNSMVNYYEPIFKRKSFHLFRNTGDDTISEDELREIEAAWEGFDRLYPEIRTAIRIVPAEKVYFKRDAEYCILLYSEKKENYLMNAGYMGEQLDLWLVAHNIGTLWFGIGKPDEPTYCGLDHVIMIAVHKVNDPSKYRKDMFKAKRKPLSEIWSGDDPGIADIVRFAPSACNTQPWYVSSRDGKLTVFRYRKPGKRGIMPAASVAFYNRIDIGIFLCFLEICAEKNGIGLERTLFTDDGGEAEMTKVAEYTFREKTGS